jgi:hypothetical protein
LRRWLYRLGLWNGSLLGLWERRLLFLRLFLFRGRFIDLNVQRCLQT